MHQSAKVVIFGVLSLVMAAAVQANEQHHSMPMSHDEMSAEQQVVSATGIVKQVDFENKKITISHEPIPAIGWPAMTMRFTFTTPDDNIVALKSGNKVDFSFIQQGNISLLQDIKIKQM